MGRRALGGVVREEDCRLAASATPVAAGYRPRWRSARGRRRTTTAVAVSPTPRPARRARSASMTTSRGPVGSAPVGEAEGCDRGTAPRVPERRRPAGPGRRAHRPRRRTRGTRRSATTSATPATEAISRGHARRETDPLDGGRCERSRDRRRCPAVSMIGTGRRRRRWRPRRDVREERRHACRPRGAPGGRHQGTAAAHGHEHADEAQPPGAETGEGKEQHRSALQAGHALGDELGGRGDEVVDDPAVGEEQHAVRASAASGSWVTITSVSRVSVDGLPHAGRGSRRRCGSPGRRSARRRTRRRAA